MGKMCKRLLALCLLAVFVMLMGCRDSGTVEDAYTKGHGNVLECAVDPDKQQTQCLLASGDAAAYTAVGLTVDRMTTNNGASASGKWDNQHQKTAITITPDEAFPDITYYDYVYIWMYSEKATSSKMQFCINCQTDEQGNLAYKRHEILVDWTGWKQIALRLEDFSAAYDADLSRVKDFAFRSTGWSMTPDPETVVYIDSVSLVDERYSFSMDAEDIGEYNYDHIIETLTGFLNGGMDLSTAGDEYRTIIQKYVTSAKGSQSSMKRGTEVPFSADMSTTAGITSNYNAIRTMAIGYSVKGGELYKDEQLLADIVYALDYMHENYYKQMDLHAYPTRNNMWDWQIGVGQPLVDTLMLIKDEITQEQIDKYLAPVYHYVPYPIDTMANRVDTAYILIAASALQKDYQRLALTRDALNECCEFVESGDGFYSDGSFVQHNFVAYTGSYGPIMLEALSKLILATSDTCFRFSEEVVNSQYNWAVESFIPLMYHGAFFGHVRGRSICRDTTDVTQGIVAVKGMIRMTEYLDDAEKREYICSVIKEYSQYNHFDYKNSLTPYDQVIYDGIVADDTISARTDYTFAKMFARMDRAVVQHQDCAVGLSLSSSRIAKYEAINGENGDGWYTGDGMVYVYTTTDDYSPEYWHNVNKYRLPGTTVTTMPREEQNIYASQTLSQYDFVGGVSWGESLVAAMAFELATYPMSAYEMNVQSTLKGKKGWFIFDDEVVCLGSDLSCSDPYNTETIIENRLDFGGVLINGEMMEELSGTVDAVTSMYLEGFGSIYMPEPTTVNYQSVGGVAAPFIELYIDHGRNFEKETYAYVLLPTMESDAGLAYAENPDITVLCNTDKVMAVKDQSSGTTGYIFWEAGSYNGVTVTNPCTVMVSETQIAVADPTQKLTGITVTVDGKTYAFEELYKGSTGVLDK